MTKYLAPPIMETLLRLCLRYFLPSFNDMLSGKFAFSITEEILSYILPQRFVVHVLRQHSVVFFDEHEQMAVDVEFF